MSDFNVHDAQDALRISELNSDIEALVCAFRWAQQYGASDDVSYSLQRQALEKAKALSEITYRAVGDRIGAILFGGDV